MKIEADSCDGIKYAYQCDLCGKVSSHRRVCYICNRDICTSCAFFDPRCDGDHPEKYCASCFNTGEKYFKRMEDERGKFDIIMEDIEQEWKDEAIEVAKLAKMSIMKDANNGDRMQR